MGITKQEVLNNLEQVKSFVQEIEENKVEKKKIKIQIKNRFTGNIIFESGKETIKEAVIEAKNSEVDLSGANLRGANLYEVDLSGANLRGANLYEVDLSGADLYEADLSGANLYEADLSGADLSEANLSEANLYGANLNGAELNCAKFYGKTDNPKILKQNQVNDFLAALGFKIDS